MHDVHHGHVETDVIHPLGEMIGDLLLLEGGTGNAEQRLLYFEHARGIDVLLHAGQFDGHGFSPIRAADGWPSALSWPQRHLVWCDHLDSVHSVKIVGSVVRL